MRRTPGGLLAIALTATVTSCSLGGPKPEPAADAVAVGFTKRDVSSLSFSGSGGKQAQTELSSMLEGMKGVPAKVTVGDLKANGDKATGILTWTWQAAGRPWVTRSPMSLVKTNNTWRVVWQHTLVHPDLKTGDKLAATTLLAPRGDIHGAGGHRIVTLRAVDRYGMDRAQVPAGKAVSSARLLAALLHVDAAAYAKRVKQASRKAFVEAITLRRGTGVQPPASAVLRIPGGRILPALAPLGPTREFAAPILGSVGQPTAEMVKKSKGTLKVGDQVGLNGLEARYDAQLTGRPGVRIDIVGATHPGRTVFRGEPVAGKPLRTTLDLHAQSLAEQALAGTTSPSALVAIRPSTGDILAAASGPKSNGYNTATYGRYAPGSTFKVVTSLALLRSGVTPDSMVDCPATVSVNGKRFKNYRDYPASGLGRIPFRT
ncbi:MAG: penicillin-binding transpeptidase domain-containing protein, partial [Actinomycetota bacterium]|nr:penicillin-binding transpeptidase domain-containing protein [Actinomycetota bacterium]